MKYEIRLKETGELLSTGLDVDMLEYLFIYKKWDKCKCDILSL